MPIVNPFSPESERIVKKHKDERLPRSEVFEQARRLISWRTSGSRKRIIPSNLLQGYDEEKDLLAQRLLFLTVALHFTPYSTELRLVRESLQSLIKARLSSLDLRDSSNMVGILSDLFHIRVGTPTVDGGLSFNGVFVGKREIYARDQLKYGEPWAIKYAVDWRELVRLVRAREIRFIDLYLVGGLALLSLKDLIEYYSGLAALKIEDFVVSRFEEFQDKKRHENVKSLVEETADLAEFLSTSAGKSYRSTLIQGRSARLVSENFPPCIKYIISGVETGSRNYAISVLLTSFLSYARAAPKKGQNPRISDYIKDPRVLTDEILPIIYDAAVRCSPPLFEDQPGEKLNVNYHLGLGLTSQVRLENSGSSHWYFPPNCEKIRRESPSLCRPDETCRQIKNPLTYYFVKFKEEEKPAEE